MNLGYHISTQRRDFQSPIYCRQSEKIGNYWDIDWIIEQYLYADAEGSFNSTG